MNPGTNALQSFILRLKGGRAVPPRADLKDIAWSGLGGMVVIGQRLAEIERRLTGNEQAYTDSA